MSEIEALKALGPFTLVQAALAVMIVMGGYFALVRGTKDKTGNGSGYSSTYPPWVMMGPGHDAIRAIHDIAEQGRHRNVLLERIDDKAEALVKEQREQTQLLEDIRNNQVARGDIMISNPPPRRKP